MFEDLAAASCSAPCGHEQRTSCSEVLRSRPHLIALTRSKRSARLELASIEFSGVVRESPARRGPAPFRGLVLDRWRAARAARLAAWQRQQALISVMFRRAAPCCEAPSG